MEQLLFFDYILLYYATENRCGSGFIQLLLQGIMEHSCSGSSLSALLIVHLLLRKTNYSLRFPPVAVLRPNEALIKTRQNTQLTIKVHKRQNICQKHLSN